jgi:phage FluMu protein Com
LLCGHIFHESCLLRLIQEFSVDKKCPQCREPIVFNTQLNEAMKQMKIGKSVARFINKGLSIENSMAAYTVDVKKHILRMCKEDPGLMLDQTKDEI